MRNPDRHKVLLIGADPTTRRKKINAGRLALAWRVSVPELIQGPSDVEP
jgi:hypothetical protein